MAEDGVVNFFPVLITERLQFPDGSLYIPLTVFGLPKPEFRVPEDPFTFLFRVPVRGKKRNWTLYCPYCKRRYKKKDSLFFRAIDGRIVRLCPRCLEDKRR